MIDYGKNATAYRRNVTDWINEKLLEESICQKMSRDGNMRQCVLTQELIDMQPRGSYGYGIEKSGYYIVYQIEVRKEVARFNLLAHQDEKLPDEVRECIRCCVVSEMNRAYRPNGEWFSTPLHLIRINAETTYQEIYAFLEEGLRLAKITEEHLKRNIM